VLRLGCTDCTVDGGAGVEGAAGRRLLLSMGGSVVGVRAISEYIVRLKLICFPPLWGIDVGVVAA
jgi:hypothetical protein